MDMRDEKAQAMADVAIERALRALFKDEATVPLTEDEFVVLAANGFLSFSSVGNMKRAHLHGLTVQKVQTVLQ